MSIRDALAPPKEYWQELARDDHPKGGGRYPGRTATVPPPRQPAPPGAPAAEAAVPPKSVAALLNAPVVLHLRGGTQLQGVLAAILTYEFVIQTRDGGFVFVMKHSVDVLEPVVTA